MKALNCSIFAIFAYFIATCFLIFLKLEHYYGWLKYEWNLDISKLSKSSFKTPSMAYHQLLINMLAT